MDNRRIALVNTTIHVPRGLEGYLENARKYGYEKNVISIVVGDRKTPPEAATFLTGLKERFQSKIIYLDLRDQLLFMRQWPAFDIVARYDSIERRNIGYLKAALENAEVIISIDDDNYVVENNYIGSHLIVDKEVELPVVSHPSGWWNICETLVNDPPRRFYPRGYPKSKQDFKKNEHQVERKRMRIKVNEGLWLKNPDVDATANIEEPLNVVRMEPLLGEESFALELGTWCSINSQNTAFAIDTLPVMYLIMMGGFFRGYRMGRYDDIWMGYFLRAIADQLNDTVSYGAPLVKQERNPHHLVKDISEELGGYILTEWIIEKLRSFKTTEKDYLGAYLDLIYYLRNTIESDDSLNFHENEYLRSVTIGMVAWYDAVRDILQAGS
ncbi:MAG: hypothetical protein ACETWK_12745 [Candidatus Aminicenantaceae bacterium]